MVNVSQRPIELVCCGVVGRSRSVTRWRREGGGSVSKGSVRVVEMQQVNARPRRPLSLCPHTSGHHPGCTCKGQETESQDSVKRQCKKKTRKSSHKYQRQPKKDCDTVLYRRLQCSHGHKALPIVEEELLPL